MLIGFSGSGKRSLTKLGAYILGHTTYALEV